MTDKKLGRLPTRSDPRALMFARFTTEPTVLPEATNFWTNRAPFPLRSFGNLDYGDCTRAKQANAHMRMERLECRRTPKIADEEVVRVYFAMTERLYGGGDTGAYETDALSEWRKPDLTFKDTKGRPLTIDAFLRINAGDQRELRAGLYTAGAHGIAICLNLPAAWQRIGPPDDWDLPQGQQPIGTYLPGSWGGHSMWADDYDATGIWLDHTWELPRQRITWRAAAVYLDEAHICIDSFDAWRVRQGRAKGIDFAALKKAVNRVSSKKID